MKAVVLAAILTITPALVDAGEMKGMDMKGDMKPMEMKDMSPSGMAKDADTRRHSTTGTVKSVDAKAGTVTLDHAPVKSMKWPAMTMTFLVKDKALMEKLGQGKKVEVEFEQRGKDYVITSAR